MDNNENDLFNSATDIDNNNDYIEDVYEEPEIVDEVPVEMPDENISSYDSPMISPSNQNCFRKNYRPGSTSNEQNNDTGLKNDRINRNRQAYRNTLFSRGSDNRDSDENDSDSDNSADDSSKKSDNKGYDGVDKSNNKKGEEESAGESIANQLKTAAKVKLKAFFVANLPIIGIAAGFIFIVIAVVLFFNNTSDPSSLSKNPRARDSQNYSCNQSSESPISVSSTPLSRQEFIDKVNAYNSSKKHYQKFKDHAGEIYDLGVQVGINPELVVIRAFNEGFAPGIRDGSDSYNYWGIGCYNKTNKYARYGSFMEGVRAFYDVILSYNTDSIFEVMSHYAYIGKNWFCPGGPSDGGCYYKKYVKPYLMNIDANRYNEVEYSCTNCTEIATTTDDQTAYSQYQVNDTIMYYRKEIFGLGSDDVKVCTDYRVNLIATPTDRDNNSIISESNGKSIKDIIVNSGSTFEAFNDGLLKTVTDAGPGSREAVGKAAIYLINTLEMHGYILPYSWSGGHGAMYTDKNGNFHNQTVHEYFGFNPNWGEDIYTDGQPGYSINGNKYTALGLDCSGFVAWALRNGGVEHPLVNAIEYKRTGVIKTYNPEDTASYIGQTGDVLSSDKHTALILSYNQEKESYLVAEEGGKDCGLVIQYRNIHKLAENDHDYKVVDLSDYYNNHKITDFVNKFNAGRMK